MNCPNASPASDWSTRVISAFNSVAPDLSPSAIAAAGYSDAESSGDTGPTMAQENVEIVRRVFAEFERGNFWVPEFFDPDVRVTWLDATPGGEAESVGIEGMTRTVGEWLRSWDR